MYGCRYIHLYMCICSCGNVHTHTGGGFSEVCRVLISGGAKVEHRVPEPKDSIYVQCSFCLKMAAHKVHAHMRTNAPRHTRAHAHTCVHTLTHAHTHTLTHTNTHTAHTNCAHKVHAHMNSRTHIHTHTLTHACAPFTHTPKYTHTQLLFRKRALFWQGSPTKETQEFREPIHYY